MWRMLEGIRRVAQRRTADYRGGRLSHQRLDGRLTGAIPKDGDVLVKFDPAPSIAAEYERGSHVAAAVQGHTTVLMDGAQFFTLDEVSTRIWQLLERRQSLSQIVQVICAEYDGPLEIVQRDTEQLLCELVRLKLITAIVDARASK